MRKTVREPAALLLSQTTGGRPPDRLSADASKSDQKKTAGRVDQTRVDQSRPENKGDTPITPAAEKQSSAQERRFAEFWTAYPKKVGKKAAQKAWEKAKPDAELFEKIMQAVATAKTSGEWLREGGQLHSQPVNMDQSGTLGRRTSPTCRIRKLSTATGWKLWKT